MKYSLYILALSIVACNNQQKGAGSSDDPSRSSRVATEEARDICWTGSLNGTTPILVHYQLHNNMVIGEITYLETRAKLPIKLIGTIEEDKTYRLLEFDTAGNVTGVIVGTPAPTEFNGSWYSPSTGKELKMALRPKDTLISSPSIQPEEDQVFGDYHYQYGKKGYTGTFNFKKAGENKAVLNVLSLTDEAKGRNFAHVEEDTITFRGSSFVYRTPDDCEFKVSFYKDFVYIGYTKDHCLFGLNATIEGIYLKTRSRNEK